MDYKSLYKDAIEADKVIRTTHTIHQWVEEGQTIIGRVIDISEFTGGKFDQPCNQYMIDTDDGIISTLMGASTDKQLAVHDILGNVVCITYKGKKLLDDNRQINLFEVGVINNA